MSASPRDFQVDPTKLDSFQAPHPGTHQMPRWDTGELPPAPTFTWKNWFAMLGPGLVMGGASIGGGEWLLGPLVTARYGGALLWLATLSILGQLVYNIEISRYTLYCGEPIFTGKFRLMPGPMFWLFLYLALDFGSVFPYLAAAAATPVAAIYLGEIPKSGEHQSLLRGLSIGIFLLALVPLVFGGKIYNSMRTVMSFKIAVVLGFLLILAALYSRPSTWWNIFSGFARFGTVPIERGEDANGNGLLDAGEDWDGDGHLDKAVEPRAKPTKDANGKEVYPDLDGDGKPDKFLDLDHDGIRDGDNVDNVFMAVLEGRPLPIINLAMLGSLVAMVGIAGAGGLTNTAVSSYTRDQGWGMGAHVGAIPSVIGGHQLQLAHVGKVFNATPETLPRWRRWMRHVARDQLVVWTPACFIGLALPSMLSVEFLRRGTEADKWTVAGMTADGVRDHVATMSGAPWWGQACWLMVLLCGFLVLAPSNTSTADGFIRRWVDVMWTGSRWMRRLDPHHIRIVFFVVLTCFASFGVIALSLGEPTQLVETATLIYNFALGFSCWHTLAVNTILLPRELRPGWFNRIALVVSGTFFTILSTVAVLNKLGVV